MKSNLATYGGYLIAAVLLVVMATGQTRQQEPKTQDDLAVHKLLTFNVAFLGMMKDLSDGKDAAAVKQMYGADMEHQPGDLYAEICKDGAQVRTMLDLVHAKQLTAQGDLYNEDDKRALNAEAMLDLMSLQVAQNQRIIEQLDALNSKLGK